MINELLQSTGLKSAAFYLWLSTLTLILSLLTLISFVQNSTINTFEAAATATRKIIPMQHNAKSIRPFIGAKNYNISRSFYRDLGFEEKVLSHNMCLFKSGELGFYLQDAYVKDWIDNTMVFMEVDNVEHFWKELQALSLDERYESVRLTPTRIMPWGKECFVHDPSGILWHFGEFFGYQDKQPQQQ